MAISRELLIHEITLKKRTGIDRDRNETYEEFRVANVRMSATIGQAQGSEGLTPSDTATLYVDAEQSKATNADGESADVKIEMGDKIEWEGRELTVTAVNPCFNGSMHHWEYGLK